MIVCGLVHSSELNAMIRVLFLKEQTAYEPHNIITFSHDKLGVCMFGPKLKLSSNTMSAQYITDLTSQASKPGAAFVKSF